MRLLFVLQINFVFVCQVNWFEVLLRHEIFEVDWMASDRFYFDFVHRNAGVALVDAGCSAGASNSEIMFLVLGHFHLRLLRNFTKGIEGVVWR